MKNKDFEDFQRYFKEYQQRFGLTGYKVYFEYEPIEAYNADIIINQANMTAIVRLDSDPLDKDKPLDIKRSAKHEAIHLLSGRLGDRARNRYVTAEEIYEALEELTHKLEGLI